MYHLVVDVLAQVPNFGNGEPPPGSEGLLKIGRWALWTVTALCVIGVFIVGGKLAVQHGHGDMATHSKGLGAVLLGCIIVGAASGIVAALV